MRVSGDQETEGFLDRRKNVGIVREHQNRRLALHIAHRAAHVVRTLFEVADSHEPERRVPTIESHSAIFEHAKAVGMYSGENPAEHVRLPEIRRKDKHALTLDQMNLLLQTLPTPARELAYLAVLTSMNIAELCGLQWKQVNLSEAWTIVDGESLPPMAIAVRRQWSTRKIEGQKGGAYHTLKAGSRRRNLPVDPEMAKVLRMVAARAKFAGPEDPVFASTSGRPVDTHNLFNRVLKPTGIKLGMPWLGWHTFRHTHATWIRQHAASPADQMAMLGHADIRMTMHYGHEDLARRRLMIEKLSAQLVEKMPEATAVAAIQ